MTIPTRRPPTDITISVSLDRPICTELDFEESTPNSRPLTTSRRNCANSNRRAESDRSDVCDQIESFGDHHFAFTLCKRAQPRSGRPGSSQLLPAPGARHRESASPR
ncbi:hypothetical protein THAOC_29750, partial [Thalassiosira oceanica]